MHVEQLALSNLFIFRFNKVFPAKQLVLQHTNKKMPVKIACLSMNRKMFVKVHIFQINRGNICSAETFPRYHEKVCYNKDHQYQQGGSGNPMALCVRQISPRLTGNMFVNPTTLCVRRRKIQYCWLGFNRLPFCRKTPQHTFVC